MKRENLSLELNLITKERFYLLVNRNKTNVIVHVFKHSKKYKQKCNHMNCKWAKLHLQFGYLFLCIISVNTYESEKWMKNDWFFTKIWRGCLVLTVFVIGIRKVLGRDSEKSFGGLEQTLHFFL